MFLFLFLCMLAGGLGMYGAASTPASQLPRIVHDIRAQLQCPDLPYGINLFVPPADLQPHSEAQQAALQQVHAYYADAAARLGLDCKIEVPVPDLAALQGNFEAQVEVRGSLLLAGCHVDSVDSVVHTCRVQKRLGMVCSAVHFCAHAMPSTNKHFKYCRS
jgi:hypothetical protein